jgi:hypothetical protein
LRIIHKEMTHWYLITFLVCCGPISVRQCMAQLFITKSGSLPFENYFSPRTLQIDRCDPTLGDLQKVTLDFRPMYGGMVTAFSPSSGSYSFSITTTFSLTGAGASISRLSTYSQSGILPLPNQPITFFVGGQLQSEPTDRTSGLESFVGVGSSTFQMAGSFAPSMFLSSGGAFVILNSLGATLDVTYEYIPVPEPTAIATVSVLTGFIAFRFLRKRAMQSDYPAYRQNI